MPHKIRLKNQKGFSLVEVIIVILVSTLIIFVVSSFSSNLNVFKEIVSKKLQSRGDVDQTLQIMTTEMRSTGPSSLGGYAIDSASTSSFTFYSDIDKDGLFERVRYFLGTSTIQKGVVKPAGNPLVYATSTETTSTVINGLVFPSSSAAVFSYYDSSYTGTQPALSSTVDVTPIRVVQVSFYVNISTSTAQPEFFTTSVDIRNLKTN